MAQVNIRIDDTLKAEGDKLFNSLGLTFSTAVSVFVSQAVRDGGMPFLPTTKADPFYSKSNMNILSQSVREAEEGKFVSKIVDELLEMEK